MRTGTYASLVISGFKIKHQELTSLLGINPTRAENEGEESQGKFGLKEKKSYIVPDSLWEFRTDIEFETDEEYNETFEKHLENIFVKLRPVKEQFLKLTKDCDAFVYMLIEYHDYTPYLEIPKKIINELAEFKLNLYFKFYFIEDPEIEK